MKRFILEGTSNKARVEEVDGVSTLFSYETEVAKFYHVSNKMEVFGYFSATTMRHINKFLEFYGFDMCTKKELEKHYLNQTV